MTFLAGFLDIWPLVTEEMTESRRQFRHFQQESFIWATWNRHFLKTGKSLETVTFWPNPGDTLSDYCGVGSGSRPESGRFPSFPGMSCFRPFPSFPDNS